MGSPIDLFPLLLDGYKALGGGDYILATSAIVTVLLTVIKRTDVWMAFDRLLGEQKFLLPYFVAILAAIGAQAASAGADDALVDVLMRGALQGLLSGFLSHQAYGLAQVESIKRVIEARAEEPETFDAAATLRTGHPPPSATKEPK